MTALRDDRSVTDAVIALDHGEWRVRRVGAGWRRYQPAGDEMAAWSSDLAGIDGDSAIVKVGGAPWRASSIPSVDGRKWFALRRAIGTLPGFASIALPPGVAEAMLKCGADASRTGGLIVVSGVTGSGKTTLSSSLFAAWIAAAGETGIAIEDPPELPLQGAHGENGYCYQVDAGGSEGFGEMLVRALRWRPRYIFLGEIRDPEAAVQLMRAAATGHVTLATLHAPSAVGAAERILGLLAQRLDNPGVALAEALALFVHVHPPKTFTDARADGLRPFLAEIIDPAKDSSVLAGLRKGDASVLKDAALRQNRPVVRR